MELIASRDITAAYVSAAIAALANIGSLVITWLTLPHQSGLAQDERLWTRRANTYVLFLQHQRDDPDFSDLLSVDLASQLIANGSEEVSAALGVIRQSSGLGKESFGQAMDPMIGQMRVELAVGTILDDAAVSVVSSRSLAEAPTCRRAVCPVQSASTPPGLKMMGGSGRRPARS